MQQSGGLGIFMFHGIGGDYITISPAVHQALINYLKENSTDIWVPTFQEAMDWQMKIIFKSKNLKVKNR